MWTSENKRQMIVRGLWRSLVSPHMTLLIIPEAFVLAYKHKGKITFDIDARFNLIASIVCNWAMIEYWLHVIAK